MADKADASVALTRTELTRRDDVGRVKAQCVPELAINPRAIGLCMDDEKIVWTNSIRPLYTDSIPFRLFGVRGSSHPVKLSGCLLG